MNSVSEYLNKINEVFNSGQIERIWYRGQSKINDKYKLLPSIYRETEQEYLEYDLFLRFKAKGVPFLKYKPETEWDWLFLMQHHGVPTRLLDWSEDALIALAFAVEKRTTGDNHEEDACVWLLNPFGLNTQFNAFRDYKFIPNVEEERIKEHFGMKPKHLLTGAAMYNMQHPISVIGSMNSDRIISQKGVFTLFPQPSSDLKPLEETENHDQFLYRIVIKKQSIDRIKQELIRFGVNENSLYPGLDSIAKEIERELKNK
ncbi:FRG domain-containing protein [Mangrovibacillus sp. Mu-81]|uniref:FRG domain-containing protein n=1 Tax=Mangrovibacillus sp. Mu-81 TaxID=3121478 RepID=UPI002FE4B0ED